jgi:tetratricopeptide (TPR) repeat protein
MDSLPPAADADLDLSAPAPQRFLAADQICGEILRALNEGQLGEAASQIASSGAEVGDALLALPGLPPRLLDALAEAFFQARDFDRAAVAAGRIADPERAALLLERGGQPLQAAALRERLGQRARAAALYLQGGAPERAAPLFAQQGDLERAAVSFEQAGQLLEAGRLWTRQRRMDRAIEALQRVPPGSPSFLAATLLLGRILEFSGHQEAALARYREVLQRHPIDASTIDLHDRLINLLIKFEQIGEARQLIARVLKFEPSRPSAVRALGSLLGRGSNDATMRSEAPGPVGQGAPSQVLSSSPPQTLTAVHPALDQLRQLPLFQELALPELRLLHGVGAPVVFPGGAVLIEQDLEASDFFVLFTGAVRVSRRAPGGEVVLAELRRGACLGEMALLDEGPTSARVEALGEVTAFRWPLPALRALLAAHERIASRVLRVLSRTLSVRLREASSRVPPGASL